MDIKKKYSFEFNGFYDHDITDLPEIVHDLCLYAPEIHTAVARTCGVKAWFLAYTLSDQYQKLDQETAIDAFESFLGVYEVLKEIERRTVSHEIE
jgi:hypothetical protein